jgi:hypothetical protein
MPKNTKSLKELNEKDTNQTQRKRLTSDAKELKGKILRHIKQ